MYLGPAFKLIFSERAFLKAELNHVEARRAKGEAFQSADDFRDEALTRIQGKRRRLLRSALWVIALVAVGALTALLINAAAPLSWLWVKVIRGVSVVLLVWAVWSKIGDIETFKGETLLELTSEHLYRVLYSAGVFLGSLALFLEGIE
ncbi:hypothetical protein [Pelagibius sp.]|uniref:hypothetical protein n=1 Tax=Pelagibius sp. TaxID=1931238 RepID=UPI003BB0E5C4